MTRTASAAATLMLKAASLSNPETLQNWQDAFESQVLCLLLFVAGISASTLSTSPIFTHPSSVSGLLRDAHSCFELDADADCPALCFQLASLGFSETLILVLSWTLTRTALPFVFNQHLWASQRRSRCLFTLSSTATLVALGTRRHSFSGHFDIDATTALIILGTPVVLTVSLGCSVTLTPNPLTKSILP